MPMATLSLSHHKTLNPLTPPPPQPTPKPLFIARRINCSSWSSSSNSSSRVWQGVVGGGSRGSVAGWAVDGNYSAKRSSSSEGRETIMLPGCDYNHWLIVMEFPKDPAPTRDQMILTYLNTLATVLGSMDEAKKNMYAFSTTTYTGFQCTVDEATSEKFKGLPGVLWVLPDSYIDVKNKDYGGDKYINGEIIPCKYPTYQPKPKNNSRYESRRYERRKDGPPRQYTRPKQEATAKKNDVDDNAASDTEESE